MTAFGAMIEKRFPIARDIEFAQWRELRRSLEQQAMDEDDHGKWQDAAFMGLESYSFYLSAPSWPKRLVLYALESWRH